MDRSIQQTSGYLLVTHNRVFEEAQADPDATSLSNLGTLDVPVTTFFYDEHGNLTRQIDPAANVTTFAYDVLNRLDTETTTAYRTPTNATATVTRGYEYNSLGNLVGITDRNGRFRDFDYDGLDRVIDEKWFDDGLLVGSFPTGYDAAGRVTSDGSASYTYDARGRLINEVIDDVHKLIHKYDNANNRTTMTVTQSGTAEVEKLSHAYQYDHLNRAKQITQTDVADNGTDTLVAGKQTIITYNRLGQYTFLRRLADTAEEPGSFSDLKLTSYAYDSAARLTSMAHTSPGKTYQYTYDILDRIATFKIGSASPRSYGYDGNSQLTNDGGTGYEYDENGNRSNYDIGADNRIIDDGSYAYRYDGEGNRIAKVVGDVEFDIDEHAYEPMTSGGSAVTYHYDLRNRLVEVISKTKPDQTVLTSSVVYTYDVDDRLSSKQVDSDGDGTPESEESYIHDGDTLLLVNGDSEQFYFYGPNNELLAQEDATDGASWAMADYQQSVRTLLHGDGTLDVETDYDAFGNQTNSSFDFRFRHHGGHVGASSTLIHMGPRVLDTTTNQFLQQDAAQESTNLYPYALNNPVNRHDRSGYFSAAHGIAWPTISAAAQEQAFPTPGRVSYGNPWFTSADRAASADLRSYWQADFARQQMAFSDRIALIDAEIGAGNAWLSAYDEYQRTDFNDLIRIEMTWRANEAARHVWSGGELEMSRGQAMEAAFWSPSTFQGASQVTHPTLINVTSTVVGGIGAGLVTAPFGGVGAALFTAGGSAGGAAIGGGIAYYSGGNVSDGAAIGSLLGGSFTGMPAVQRGLVGAGRGFAGSLANYQPQFRSGMAYIPFPARAVEVPVAARVRLLPAQYKLSRPQHAEIALSRLQAKVMSDPSYASQLQDFIGRRGVARVIAGRTPQHWVWHHALTDQAEGQAGWMWLARRRQHHTTMFDVFHPKGYGGYSEWAIPAGAPANR